MASQSPTAGQQAQPGGRLVWAWHPTQRWERARVVDESSCRVAVKFMETEDETKAGGVETDRMDTILQVTRELVNEVNPEDNDDLDDLTRSWSI